MTNIKVDVIINDYQWISGNTSKLVLAYAVHGDDRLVFDIQPTATASVSGTVNVTLRYANKRNT